MSKFFLEEESYRVNFPDGQWLDIKPEFSQVDHDYITTRMMQAKVVSDGDKKPEAQMDMSFGRQATLERGILVWSFTDDSGAPVPVTPENISNLRTKYRNLALSEIDRLNSEALQFAKN